MMIRAATAVLISLAVVGCGKEADIDTDAPPSAQAPASFDAFIEYRGKRYEMSVPGECGAKPDGTYLTWAFTLDSEGKPAPEDAHMYAMREAYWSVIDFYSPDDDRIVRIYREGPDRFGFEEGVLEFEGELGAGLTEQARVRIVCPDSQSAFVEQGAQQ